MPQSFIGLDIGQSTLKAIVFTGKGSSGGSILAADKCESWEDALKASLNSMESGAAFEKLNQLIRYYEN